MKPSDLYSKLIEDGLLSFDAEQSKLLNRLDQLNFDLVKRSKAWFGQKKIKGLYIRGEVGRGKTQIMDIFFQTLPVKNKKRVLVPFVKEIVPLVDKKENFIIITPPKGLLDL